MPNDPVVIEGLHHLIEELRRRGYRVVGPTVRDNAIVLDELDSADDLPHGWGVDVGPGRGGDPHGAGAVVCGGVLPRPRVRRVRPRDGDGVRAAGGSVPVRDSAVDRRGGGGGAEGDRHRAGERDAHHPCGDIQPGRHAAAGHRRWRAGG